MKSVRFAHVSKILCLLVLATSCKVRGTDSAPNAEVVPEQATTAPAAATTAPAIATAASEVSLAGRVYEDEMLLRLAFIDEHTLERRYQSQEISPEKGTYSAGPEGGTLDLGEGPVPFKLGDDRTTLVEDGRVFKLVTE